MIHIIYHDALDEVCLYDDEQKSAVNADREFNHAMVCLLSSKLKSSGRVLDFLRGVFCTVAAKFGKPQPEFFGEKIIDDTRNGTRYRIKIEIIPGGCDVGN